MREDMLPKAPAHEEATVLAAAVTVTVGLAVGVSRFVAAAGPNLSTVHVTVLVAHTCVWAVQVSVSVAVTHSLNRLVKVCVSVAVTTRLIVLVNVLVAVSYTWSRSPKGAMLGRVGLFQKPGGGEGGEGGKE